jgi:hypothetical protein
MSDSTTTFFIGTFEIAGYEVRLKRLVHHHSVGLESETILAEVDTILVEGKDPTYFNGASDSARGALLDLSNQMSSVQRAVHVFEFAKDAEWAFKGGGQAPSLHRLALDLQNAAWSLGKALDAAEPDDVGSVNLPRFPRVADAA